jgi:hypothetical protein
MKTVKHHRPVRSLLELMVRSKRVRTNTNKDKKSNGTAAKAKIMNK